MGIGFEKKINPSYSRDTDTFRDVHLTKKKNNKNGATIMRLTRNNNAIL